MSGILPKLKSLFIEDNIAEYQEDLTLEEIINTKDKNFIIIIKPKNSDSAQLIADILENNKSIIILDLSLLEKEQSTRMLDFLSGILYVNQGNLQKITDTIYIIANKQYYIKNVLEDEINNYTD